MSRVVAIIQARLGSTRLQNKVLLQIPPESGISMLELVIRKASLATLLDDVVVTTPDKALWKVAQLTNTLMTVYGGKRDVLKEYLDMAISGEADVIVRLTADCPLLRPEVIDECVKEFLDGDYDLVYNTECEKGDMTGDGTDVEVFGIKALRKAYKESENREHVTSWMRRHLRCKYVSPPDDFVGCSVDTWDDYIEVCKIVGM